MSNWDGGSILSGFIDWLENLAGQLEEITETRTEKEYLGDDDSGGEPEWMSDSSKAPNDRLFWVKARPYVGSDWIYLAAWRSGVNDEFPWTLDRSTTGFQNEQCKDDGVAIICEIVPE